MKLHEILTTEKPFLTQHQQQEVTNKEGATLRETSRLHWRSLTSSSMFLSKSSVCRAYGGHGHTNLGTHTLLTTTIPRPGTTNSMPRTTTQNKRSWQQTLHNSKNCSLKRRRRIPKVQHNYFWKNRNDFFLSITRSNNWVLNLHSFCALLSQLMAWLLLSSTMS